jgi:ketosteroid isomerase-like protein
MRAPGFKISWEPVTVYVASAGDVAYLVERNTITLNDSLGNRVTTHGKVLTVWRKDAHGRWKNLIDMWNDTPGARSAGVDRTMSCLTRYCSGQAPDHPV